jgi:starch-binding outer membrane protein, SusD/RagB family
MFLNKAIKYKNMNKIANILICTVISSIILVGCSDLIDVNSKRQATEDQYGSSANDSLFAEIGVLSQVQKLADAYVLLGELRGDLMDISATSDLDLREINNFDISSTNTYVNLKNYYSVINNCNYILQKLDTNKVDRGLKLSLREYAAIKSIRAWTYMQIALNYKTAKYYENPVLTVEDTKKIYPEYEMNELADVLIADLLPLKAVDLPNIISLNCFPIRVLLGDLYLWKGEYENAANSYRDFMYANKSIVNGEKDKNTGIPTSNSTMSYWTPVNNTISTSAALNWINSFSLTSTSTEVISVITCPTQYGQDFYLDSLNNQHKIVPSTIAINNWDSQTYYLNEASNTQGDLRKYGSISYSAATNLKATTDYSFTGVTADSYLIYKYKAYNQNVGIYRSSLIYLRYAEAVNRLNKPNLAFAVLKYGLNSTNLFNTKIIPLKERGVTLPNYMSLTDSRFNNNVGIRMHGLGNMDKDTTFYRMPKRDTMQDSVLCVEDLIQQELALETAFEGNRFQDLMRITLRRIKNGEGTAAYLADKVGAKNPAVKTKLLTIDNWYIKK